jgi:protein-disulfide isomerase
MSKQARIRARQRAARRTRLAFGVGGAVIAALVIAIIAVVVNSGPPGDAADGVAPSGAVVAPANSTLTGALAVGRADAPVTVEIYLDYMCPYCGRFEKSAGADLVSLVAAGKVKLQLHPLAFLDRMSSGTRYSTRTANAVATVADRAPTAVLAFNNALYAAQPAEGSTGLSDDQIATIAVQAGVPQEVVNGFTDRTYEPWIAAATQKAFQSGITGTPTVKINGTVFQDLYTPGALKSAVEAAGE